MQKQELKSQEQVALELVDLEVLQKYFENTRMNGYEPNNNIWLRNIHRYSKEKWIELFKALAENKNIDDLDFQQIPMSEPSTYK